MNSNPLRSALTPEDVRKVSPALERYTRSVIGEELWKRPELSPRDRGMVTVAALIARSQIIGMLHYFNLALDNGVKPGELSEIIILRSTLDGPMPLLLLRLPRTSLSSAGSGSSFHLSRLNFCR